MVRKLNNRKEIHVVIKLFTEAVHSNMVYCSDRGSHTKTGDIIHTSTEQPKTKFPGTGEPLGGVGIKAKTDVTDSVKARERRNQSFLGTFTQGSRCSTIYLK